MTAMYGEIRWCPPWRHENDLLHASPCCPAVGVSAIIDCARDVIKGFILIR